MKLSNEGPNFIFLNIIEVDHWVAPNIECSVLELDLDD